MKGTYLVNSFQVVMSQKAKRGKIRTSISSVARRQSKCNMEEPNKPTVSKGLKGRRPLADRPNNKDLNPMGPPAGKKTKPSLYVQGVGISPIADAKENLNPFLSVIRTPSKSKSQQDDILNDLDAGHDTMMAILSARCLKIKAAASLFAESGASQVLSHVTKLKDASLTNDMLPILENLIKQKKLTVEALIPLSPVLGELLKSKYETYAIAGIQFLKSILQKITDPQERNSATRMSNIADALHPLVGQIKLLRANNEASNQATVLQQQLEEQLIIFGLNDDK